MPRLVSAPDFDHLERGLAQRLRALGAFLDDIYDGQRILASGLVPPDMIVGAAGYRPTLWRRQDAPAAGASASTSPASISSGIRTAPGACSRTTCATRRGCRT